jgi:hypothetical protein
MPAKICEMWSRVVDGPRREQLAERDLAQRRVPTALVEVAFVDELGEPGEALRSELREALDPGRRARPRHRDPRARTG